MPYNLLIANKVEDRCKQIRHLSESIKCELCTIYKYNDNVHVQMIYVWFVVTYTEFPLWSTVIMCSLYTYSLK